MDDETIRRLMTLFRGFAGAYGTYQSEDKNTNKGGKLEIRSSARTVREPVTLDLWRKHVNGETPLGVITIREDNTCYWGAIDVDRYDIVHDDLLTQIEKNKLPLIMCRSKSGGAHLFLFSREPIPASDMVTRLREMSAILSLGNCEIFPKQTKILLDRGDLGNWLNMPYFNGDKSTRYAIKAGGLMMTLREFVVAAERRQISHEQLILLGAKTQPTPDEMMSEGPPCLQHLTNQGFPEGTRNNGLMALGVFCKKKFGDNWEYMIDECNRRYLKPPLPTDEVADIIRRLKKKDYNYRCGEVPISAHCNSAVCRGRRFGIGGSDDFPVVSGLSVLETEPPLWFLDIEGERLEMITDDLLNYRRFHKVCTERLVKCYQPLKQNTWMSIVSEAMKGAVRIEAPPEIGLTGQFNEYLEDFCMNRHRGKSKEDILSGRPWEDEETNKHFFRLRDLMGYLEREGFKGLTRSQVTVRLKHLGGGAEFFNIKGKGVNVWFVPNNFVPVKRLDTPKRQEEPI